jgi:hypothetical protein
MNHNTKDKSALDQSYFGPARQTAKNQVYGSIEASKRKKKPPTVGSTKFKEDMIRLGVFKNGNKD